jgi:two-component system chemotaxis sensor kinase CheA
MSEHAALDPSTISNSDFSAFTADSEMVAGIITEWREHLSAIEEKMLLIEKDANDLESVNAVFRYVHTIKGLAGFLELKSIQDISHEVETLLDHVRSRRLAITPALVDSIFSGIDFIRIEIDRLQRHVAGEEEAPAPNTAGLLGQLRSIGTEITQEQRTSARSAPAPGAALMAESPALTMPLGGDQTEGNTAGETEVPAVPANPASAATETAASAIALSETPAPPSDTEPPAPITGRKRDVRPSPSHGDERSVRIDTAKLDRLMNMVGELVIAQTLVANNPLLAAIQDQRLQSDLSLLNRIAAEVQRATTSMRMVPIGTQFQKTARLVRDLSRQLGKQVALATSGEETELDKTIAEALSGPLLHMVRNSVDHGIETAEERALTAKDPTAQIRLAAYHKSAQIVIEVADDGRGLDRGKILAKAVERGLVPANTQLSDTETFQLIFEPGFSTAEKLTEISGRGVGLDVVMRHVQKLRGRIEIQSAAGVGTTFFLRLPLTLGIIDCLVVAVGGARYILPLYSVAEIFCPTLSQVRPERPPGGDAVETVVLRGVSLPVVRLHRRFHLTPRTEDLTQGMLLVSEAHGRRFCLFVDEMIGKQEIVIKSLGDTFGELAGLMGCAVLADGQVGLILDVEGVYRPEIQSDLSGDDRPAYGPAGIYADKSSNHGEGV